MNLKLLTLYCLSVAFTSNSCLIRKLNKQHLVSKYSKEYFEKNDSTFEIIKTESGREFAVGGHYIFDISNQKKYVYPKTRNTYTEYLKNTKNGIFETYSLTKVDKENNIWILFNYGEFGGGMYVFNLNENKYENIPTNHLSKLFAIPDSAFYLNRFNPDKIYESEHDIYIYSYISHISTCASILYRFNGIKPEIEVFKTNGYYEGATVYDKVIYVHHPDSCKITDLESYIKKK